MYSAICLIRPLRVSPLTVLSGPNETCARAARLSFKGAQPATVLSGSGSLDNTLALPIYENSAASYVVPNFCEIDAR